MMVFFAISTESQSITAVPTFNNIGLTVDLSGTSSASNVNASFRLAGTTNSFRPALPFSQLSPTEWKSCVFNVASSTTYEIKITSDVFPDQLRTVSTRSDLFPDATNKVFHVAITGSDSNDGLTLATAFRTVGHAVSNAAPGTKILIHAGTYYEGNISVGSGTPTQPIVIEAASGEHVILSGLNPSFDVTNDVPWTPYNGLPGAYFTPLLSTPNAAYLNGGQLFNYTTTNVALNPPSDQPGGFLADGSNLYVRFPDNGSPTANRITIPAQSVCFVLDDQSNVQIRDLEICYYGSQIDHKGIYLNASSMVLVTNCYFHQNGVGVGIKRNSNFNTIENCTFTEYPINTWSWNAVKSYADEEYEEGGVAIYTSTDPGTNQGNVVRFCTFTNLFDGSDLYSDSPVSPTEDMDYYGNTIAHCRDDGISTDGYGSIVCIYDNRVEDTLTGISTAPDFIGPTYLIRNYILNWNTTESFPSGYPFKFNSGEGPYSASSNPVYLFHNTAYTTNSMQWGFGFNDYVSGMTIVSRNNIYRGTWFALQAYYDPTGIDFDYDDVFTTYPSAVSWNDVTYGLLSAFSAATGQEIHGITNEPTFVNAPLGDFYPSPTSPALNRGVLIPGINDDYVGSAPDIGAAEGAMNAQSVSINGTTIAVNWNVSPFQSYQLQMATNLNSPNWISVGQPIATNSSHFQTIVNLTAAVHAFFRLERIYNP